jgi:hypothetical protein
VLVDRSPRTLSHIRAASLKFSKVLGQVSTDDWEAR